MKRIVSLVAVAALVGGGVWGYLYTQSRGNAPKYRTARVERGPLTAAVSATGNLNAVTTVLVGSQVSGQVKELFADFNTLVKKNQVIARIDPEIFQAKVSQASADLESSRAAVLNQEAQVQRARADVENARATLAESRANTAKAQVTVGDSKRDLDRKSQLFRRELIAKSDLDSAQAAHDSALAQLDAARAKERSLTAGIESAQAQMRVAEAMLQSARAQVDQKRAALRQAQVDLEHTTIRAPVNGVVVSRAVDVGQTVAASLQAPTLFTIAEDLTKMQVEVSVDEADIGRIKLEDRASFTVDSFPGQPFTGTVTQIRKAAQVVQNVVTYTVVVAVDNPGGRLLPGMTANARMIVAEKPNVLKVPNAALRFRPAGAEGGAAAAGGPAGPAARQGGEGGGERAAGGGRPSPEQVRERLVKGLGLSEEQQRKLDPILADTRQQLMALQGVPEAERQARAQKIREASRTRIREILTPEQRERYEEFAGGRGAAGGDPRSGAPGRVWVLDGDKLKPVALTLGISDGAATEVLRGEVKEGQEIVVGMVGTPGAARPGGAGPRLRL
ncbi:MAG TPA: efflux RND transporter periplasmic adaptor subunit [Methylomirabilota bacterium]|nr:efflux RND transporter periplasmic adaptor subunit [Methylomirabilota bacterium]